MGGPVPPLLRSGPMKAAIVAVGSELLSGDRLDTNSLLLTRVLHRYGIAVGEKVVIGDEESAIAGVVRDLLQEHDLVLLTGGLGPTADDVTREGVAGALARSLSKDESALEVLRQRFAAAGMSMAASNERQIFLIDGGRWIENRRGTAPGIYVEAGEKVLMLFPGFPEELGGMVEGFLIPWLSSRSTGIKLEERHLKVACLAESQLEERITPVYREFGRQGISVLARAGEIEIRLTAIGDEAERQERLDRLTGRLRELLGERLFGFDETTTLEARVGELLRQKRATVATAESCTAGLVAERITRVSGSSDYFLGAIVAYANSIKERLLGVPTDLLARVGAVSEEVAIAMAEGARTRTGADYALALTGIAGPTGGSEEKPVGTVHIALARPQGATKARRLRFPGTRQRVREFSTVWALDMLRVELEDEGREGE